MPFQTPEVCGLVLVSATGAKARLNLGRHHGLYTKWELIRATDVTFWLTLITSWGHNASRGVRAWSCFGYNRIRSYG